MRKTLGIALATSLIGGAVVSAAPARAAEADATTATVTSFSGPTFGIDDDDIGHPGILVSGTSDGSDATLDVRCYWEQGGSHYQELGSVVTADDGSWSQVFDPANTVDYLPCHLRAIPDVTPSGGGTPTAPDPADASAYPGPFIALGSKTTHRYASTTTSGGVAYDFAVYAGQRLGYIGTDSAGGDCDDNIMVLDTSDTSVSKLVVACQGDLYPDDSFPAAGSQDNTLNLRGPLLVDGTPAELPAAQQAFEPDDAGTPAPGVTYSVTQDPSNGNTAIVETEPLVRCADPSYPQTADKCATTTPAGVSLQRVSADYGDGRITTVRDTYVSTDGRAHSLDAEYLSGFNPTDNGAGYTFPQDHGAVVTHAPNDLVTGFAPGPGSAFVTLDHTQPTSARNPEASLTWSSAPSRVLFGADYGGGYAGEFLTDYDRVVPAGGHTTLTQTFSDGESAGEVKAYAASAETAAPPSVTLTTPGGAVAARAETITGRFAAGGNGLPTVVRAGGFSAPVAADGSFSLPVTLAPTPGAQSFAVMGVDDGGLVAAAQTTFVYSDPVTLGTPKPVVTEKTVVTHKGGKTIRTKVNVGLAVRISVSCASLGVPCVDAVTVTAGHTVVGSAAPRVASGATSIIVVKLSPAALKGYVAAKHPPKKHGKAQKPTAYPVAISGRYVEPDGTAAFPAASRILRF